MVVTAKEAAGPAETPCATHLLGDVPPRALVAAGATANPVRHGTAPDLTAVAVLADGANGQTVSREIAGYLGDPAAIAPALNWPSTSSPRMRPVYPCSCASCAACRLLREKAHRLPAWMRPAEWPCQLPRGAVHRERRFCQLRLLPCHLGQQPYPSANPRHALADCSRGGNVEGHRNHPSVAQSRWEQTNELQAASCTCIDPHALVVVCDSVCPRR